MVYITSDGAGEGEQEVDDDSDYEGEPTSGLMEAGTNGSVQEGGIPCLDSVPGAFTT